MSPKVDFGDVGHRRVVRDWWKDSDLQVDEITAVDLVESGAGWEVVAFLRSKSLEPMLEGMKIGKQNETGINLETAAVFDVMESGMKKLSLGERRIEEFDRAFTKGRTQSRIFPIETSNGAIELVLNPAWGLGWRLSPDHEATEMYPEQLIRVQWEDETEPPYDEEQRGWYLDPSELVLATEELVMNVGELERDLGLFLEKLLSGSVKISQGRSERGKHLVEDQFTVLIIESEEFNAGVEIKIGETTGIKEVDTFGLRLEREEFSELSRMGYKISENLEKFYEVPHL